MGKTANAGFRSWKSKSKIPRTWVFNQRERTSNSFKLCTHLKQIREWPWKYSWSLINARRPDQVIRDFGQENSSRKQTWVDNKKN